MNTELARIAAFGIQLRRVVENDIPLLCHWRNQAEILPYMDDPRPVDPKIMYVWLNKIRCDDTTIPYIAYMDNKPVAYTEIKHINWKNESCEGGMFLFGQDYIGTGIAYNIILCREIIMNQLNLKTLISRVHFKNTRSIHFCTKYGGKYMRKDGNFLVYSYEFTYRRERLKFIAGILGMSDDFLRYIEGRKI